MVTRTVKKIERARELLADCAVELGAMRPDGTPLLTSKGVRVPTAFGWREASWGQLIRSSKERVSSRAYHHDEGRKMIAGLKRVVRAFEKVAR